METVSKAKVSYTKLSYLWPAAVSTCAPTRAHRLSNADTPAAQSLWIPSLLLIRASRC